MNVNVLFLLTIFALTPAVPNAVLLQILTTDFADTKGPMKTSKPKSCKRPVYEGLINGAWKKVSPVKILPNGHLGAGENYNLIFPSSRWRVRLVDIEQAVPLARKLVRSFE